VTHDTRLLRYGPLQLTIAAGTLTSIAVELLSEPGADGDVARTATPYDVVRIVREGGGTCRIEPKYTFDVQLCLRTSAGTLAFFDLEHAQLSSVVCATEEPPPG
jgi:hypothetical protein